MNEWYLVFFYDEKYWYLYKYLAQEYDAVKYQMI